MLNELSGDLQHVRDRALSVSKVCNRWIAPACSSNALMMRAARVHWRLGRAISGWVFALPSRADTGRGTAFGDFARSIQVNRLTMQHITQEMRAQWVREQTELLHHQLASVRAYETTSGLGELLDPHQTALKELRSALSEYCMDQRLSQAASRNRWRWSAAHNAVESFS